MTEARIDYCRCLELGMKKGMWRIDPALVLVIWTLRYISSAAVLFMIYMSLRGAPFIAVFVVPMVILHAATWIGWK